MFFETYFTPYRVLDRERPEGLFTGYYEPEVKGSRRRHQNYPVPIYARPDELIAFDMAQRLSSGLSYGRLEDGKPSPFFSRREIEEGVLSGRGLEIVWLKSWEDAFFIHVQGSGRVVLEDGQVVRLAYAAKSGRPYTSIGGVLADTGEIAREQLSMQAIRAWIAANPVEGRKLMWKNESFIFFREALLPDPALGATGAQDVQLTPGRSLAIDRSVWQFGTPVWLDTVAPTGVDAALQPFRRLMVAQDTGSAIKGMARGDVYWGFGDLAAQAAGHMKSPGTMIVLLPRSFSATRAKSR